ncbi:uncharacterized protein M421DRAFT_99332 [Didymella exigua CBS 183.55]|uniref:3'-phosphate/5'-hydroxy nucleic acid ligase n=1 Tax=Didymella exigua CBS 183.55 TaxID=1150837 RepID=A0A6A5RQI7_9PLEO|nr:uncharacterized protein M421DRAFT_99332 [Didymella exigua CBS 183.55]KAF1930701.1 hypothetical protein M421DRAFT_99332 [Didymella exigua CBS 183.55]
MATRVTVASNAQQSQKALLLAPVSAVADPVAANSVRSLVLKTAQARLKLKKPVRVFIKQTGQELTREVDWKTNIKNDVVLLVSAGEEYVGLKKAPIVHGTNPTCPVELLASKAPVESLATTQLTTTAHTLPGIVRAVAQPDLHPGTRFPIGAVFVSERWIHPPLIGGDIGCGMTWYRLSLSRSAVDGDKGRRVAEKLRGLEGPWRSREARELWLTDEQGCCDAGEEWDKSVGTIGVGNHFVEVQGDVVMLVHSGSRGYGGSVLKKFAAVEKASLEEGSLEAEEYLKEHDRACRWARANRDLIAMRFLACLEPGNEDWRLGLSDVDTPGVDAASIEHSKTALNARKVVDIWHNNVERVPWPPSPPSSTPTLDGLANQLTLDDTSKPQDYVYIHRKGAAPTYNPLTRQPLPLLPLPGSRGTPTLMLSPTFSDTTSWGLKNALSLAHGAGRSMSRTKALSSLSQKYKGQNILQPRAGDAEGTWVVCDEKDLVFEETPDAYKDVQAVGQDLVDAGAARIAGWCRARVSYKVRNEGR